MSFIKRLGYYLGGFSLGLVIVVFFFNNKKTQCNYSPNARVIKNISEKKWTSNTKTILRFDSLSLKKILRKASVDFGKSDTKLDSCKIYFINTKIEQQNYQLEVQNCEKTVHVLSLSSHKED